jgi:hypothetical protein
MLDPGAIVRMVLNAFEFLGFAFANLKANRGLPAPMRWLSAAVSAD